MATKITTRVLADDAVTDAKIADVTLTTATQSASDNTTKIATTAYVTTAIANLADSAPSTLNTLNELAAALGDDANYATTTTNAIATKLPLAGGTLTGNLIGKAVTLAPDTAGKLTIRLTTNAANDGRIVIRSDTTDKVDIQANGVSYFNGGNVGIGTSSPDEPIHIYGSGYQRLKVQATGAGNGADIQLKSKNDSTQWILFNDSDSGNNSGVIKYVHSTNKMHFRTNDIDDRLVIDASGRVGIGTSPSNILHTSGTGVQRIQVDATDNHAAGAGLYMKVLNSGSLVGTATVRVDNTGNIDFFNGTSSESQKMTIRSDGGVAIGINNAGYSSQILSVKAASADTVFYGESTDAKCIMSVRDGDSTANVGYGAHGNAHVFSQDGAEIARFSTGSADKYPTSGNGGIGGAGTNLHLHSDDSEIRMANNIIHSDNSGLTKFTIRNAYGYHSTGAELSLDSGYISFNTGTSYTESMRIDSSGKVGIGTTGPQAKFMVNQATVNEVGGFFYNNTSTNAACLRVLQDGAGSSGPALLVRQDGSGNAITVDDGSDGSTVFSVSQNGAVSKASGSFKIDHPLPAKKDTHHLVHSFVEAPQADNIYRGTATLSSGTATINLDTVSGMTEGTYVLLNTNTSCFTSNETDWDAVKGSVSGNILTITCQNDSSTATVSWLVIGERHDQHMKDTDWTDSDGKVIVETLKG